MSLFRTFDRTSAVSHTVLTRPFLEFLYPISFSKPSDRKFSKRAIKSPPKPSSNGQRMDSFFIQALARAGSCPQHARHISIACDGTKTITPRHKIRRKAAPYNCVRREFNSTKAERRGPFKKVKQFAESELKALVDYYGIDLAAESHEEVVEDGPLVWNVGDDHEPWPSDDPQVHSATATIEQLLKDEESSHVLLYDSYKLLPPPRVVYLRSPTIRALLHHLSVLERPTEVAMQRFLAILDDMQKAHIHITRSEWTTAIHLVGRFLGKVSDEQVQSALQVWRDMEHRAGVKGGTVTMNVLFDIAVKSGKYTLAETFLKELKARRLKLHRHFRVSLLYYYGVMHDGNGVRKIYHDMVEAGDVIDTVVMNAVIAALTRAGENGAAEHVFERMKRLHGAKASPFPGNKTFNIRTWRGRRSLGIHLTNEARALSKSGNLDKLKELQDYAPIAPNSRTYSILIRHQARVVGDIDRVNDLLREMGYNGVPIEGSIFVVIFHGFSNFGGVRYTSWTPDKLEQTWKEYLKAVHLKMDRTWISKMAVVSALKAFKKCMDSERTLRAWEEVRTVWEPTQRDEQAVLRVLGMLVPQRDFFDSEV